jgi:hypothetical protein
MKRRVSVLALLLIPSVLVFAQKVKYKDLVVLLNAKQYETAEPFLKKYLKENTDHPNAHLFMGIIFQEKSLSIDLLKHTTIALANADSAILFFDKAYNSITEKELKRNDEYYQEMYSRRDMRSGEFVIKLSDVRLDLETRVKNLKERKEKVRELKSNFDTAERLYAKSNDAFKSIKAKYNSENEFYLQSDQALVNDIKRLAQTYDSALSAFSNYKEILKRVGKTNYNQQLSLQEIADWKDGISIADFYSNDLKIWDYKRWSKSSLETIENVIGPLRDRLIGYDIALNKLYDKVKKDSVSVINEVASLDDGLLYSQLQKYDEDPLPLGIFQMKKAELLYKSSFISHAPYKDTSKLVFKLSFLKEELRHAKLLDSIGKKLVKRDLDKEAENYRHFISNAYGTKAVLKSLINTTEDYGSREKLKREIEWERTMQATKWVIAGTDSIPIFTERSRELRFKPLVILENKYTVGLQYNDSLATGYFYSITPSRIPDIKATFPVDQLNFTKRNLPLLKCLTTTDPQEQVLFTLIFSEGKVKEQFPVTIAKVNRTGGLAWSKNLKFDFLPSELTYFADREELSIKLSTMGEEKAITIDKNGKKLQ